MRRFTRLAVLLAAGLAVSPTYGSGEVVDECNWYADWDEVDFWNPDDHKHTGNNVNPEIVQPDGEWKAVTGNIRATGTSHADGTIADSYTFESGEHTWCGTNG
jgi:hypothetical protein